MTLIEILESFLQSNLPIVPRELSGKQLQEYMDARVTELVKYFLYEDWAAELKVINPISGETVEMDVLLEKCVQSDQIKQARINGDNALEVSIGGEFFMITSNGHKIIAGNGAEMPNRPCLKFDDATIEDDGRTLKISGLRGEQGPPGPVGFFRLRNFKIDAHGNVSLIDYDADEWNPNYVLRFGDSLPTPSSTDKTALAIREHSDPATAASSFIDVFLWNVGTQQWYAAANSPIEIEEGTVILTYLIVDGYFWAASSFNDMDFSINPDDFAPKNHLHNTKDITDFPKKIVANAVLSATAWSGTAPFFQTVANGNINDDSSINISLNSNDLENMKEWASAGICNGKQSPGALTLYSITKPLKDLPITLEIIGVT